MEVRLVRCKSALSRSRLPGLNWALNPYRGCSHSCAYCYAQDVTRFELGRPWGSVLEVKTNIVQVLRKELRKDIEGVVGVGTVTDPYQPAEKRHELTRGCLALLRSKAMEVSVLTKSSLVLRDLDILSGWSGAEVGLSVATMNERVSSLIEPHAPPPSERMAALETLTSAGVRVYLMAAPVVRGLSDDGDSLHELISAASSAGVRRVMWDMYSRKPIAGGRLERVLQTASKAGLVLSPKREIDSIRADLEGQCSALGMELVDAF